MKVKYFTIPIYNISIALVEVEKNKDANDVQKVLINSDVKDSDIQEICSNIENGCLNGGENLFHPDKRDNVILLYRQTSVKNRLCTLGHEMRHATDRILEFVRVDDIESSALLAGYLTRELFI